MAPVLYMVVPSPAVRAVLITADALGLDLVQKEVDLVAGEHLKPDFLKVND
jgi:glutathione S-transferase